MRATRSDNAPVLSYADFEAILADLQAVPEEHLKAFRARLRVFRDFGVPTVERPGKGSRVTFGEREVWLTQVALVIERFGVVPARVARLLAGRENLLDELRQRQTETQEDVWALVFLAGGDTRDPADPRIAAIIRLGTAGELVQSLQRGPRPNMYGLINLSQQTKDVEHALRKVPIR